MAAILDSAILYLYHFGFWEKNIHYLKFMIYSKDSIPSL